jgi:hypothetical protein
VRVSGDQRLLRQPEVAGLLARAGSFVTRFSYRDHLVGKPVHVQFMGGNAMYNRCTVAKTLDKRRAGKSDPFSQVI